MLELRNVYKQFKSEAGTKEVLKGLSFSLPSTGLFSIMGESGSGKSTLLSLIASFDVPTKGEVIVGGTNIGRLSPEKATSFRNQTIGFLFQRFDLIEGMGALENVILPGLVGGAKKCEVEEKGLSLLESFGLKDKANQNVSLLSGGEKQRVALARALINDPPLLLCDEPTGSLDRKNGLAIMERLKEESKSRLVVVVTHDKDLATRYSDEILRLENGILKGTVKKKETSVPEIKRKKRENGAWLGFFRNRNIREDKGLLSLSFLCSLVFCLTFFLFAGFSTGMTSSFENERFSYMEAPQASISEKETYEVEGTPVSLSRSTRPSKSIVSGLLSKFSYLSYEPDFSYFVPSSVVVKNGKEGFSTQLVPVYDLTLREFGRSLLVSGSNPKENNLSTCLINSLLSEERGIKVGDTLEFQTESQVDIGEVSGKVVLPFEMEVVGIVEEFSYLSTPKVFYSYRALKKEMQGLEVGGFLDGYKGIETLYDLVVDSSGDSPYSSYSYLLFCHEEKALPDFYDSIDLWDQEELYSVTSFALLSSSSFESLTNGILALLPAFFATAILSLSFCLFSLARCRYAKREKEGAILSCLGVRQSSLRTLYSVPEICLSVLAWLISFSLCFLFEDRINSLMDSWLGIPGAIAFPFKSWMGIPYLLPVLTLVSGIIVIYLGCYFASRGNSRRNLAMALREE